MNLSYGREDRAVAQLAGVLACECGLHPMITKHLESAAALHDVGKMLIPQAILSKPGKLDADEFEIIKSHTNIGADLLAGMKGMMGEMARTIALYHHERYDGQGYWGKYDGELPAYVGIVALSDVFVALVNERPYKKAWPPQEALGYIEQQAGAHFNPSLIQIFLPLAQLNERVRTICEGA